MQELLRIIKKIDPEVALPLFQRVTQVIKSYCQSKGIYSYKLGYLNGISIMIMVVYVMGQIFHRIKDSHEMAEMTQFVIIEFFRTFGGQWDWHSNYI